MSPILVRPVREQLEHDRVVQALLARWRRRYEVAVNVGADETVSLRVSGTTVHPDLVLTSTQGGRKLAGVVEVETAESVNHLEAMAQWANMGHVRAPFHLYVPAGAVDVARRLCQAHGVNVAEIWSYHAVGDTLRFSLAHKTPPRSGAARSKAKPASVKKSGAKKAAARKSAAAKPTARKKTAVTRKKNTTGAAKARPVKHK